MSVPCSGAMARPISVGNSSTVSIASSRTTAYGGLLLVGAGIVHRTDVVIVQAHQADRLPQPFDEQGFAGFQVIEVGDDFKGHGYFFLPLAARRGAGWLPRTSIQPLRTRLRITGC